MLKLELVSGEEVTLHWMEMSNKTYTVQCTEALGSGVGSRVLDVLAGASNRVEVCRDRAFAGRTRIYRLVTPRLP